MKDKTSKDQNKIIYLLLLGTALALSIHTCMDTDVFYMFNTGQYILDHKTVPNVNPFVHAQGLNMVVQNWLYCVLLTVIKNIAYLPGLYIFFVLQLYIYLILIYKVISAQNDALLSIAFTALSGYTVCYLNLRPEILTTALLLAQFVTLNKYLYTKNTKWLCFWPLIMLLEINLHASYWIIHYVILLPHVIPIFKNKYIHDQHIKLSQNKTILWAALSMVPALFLNPYKTQAITYVFQSLSSPEFKEFMPYITEQRAGYANIVIFVIMMIIMILTTITIKNKRLNSPTLYMLLGWSVLTIIAAKWTSFMPIACAYLSHDFLINKRLPEQDQNINQKKTILCIALIAITPLFAAMNTQTFLPKIYQRLDPFVKTIKTQDPDAYVYTTFSKNNYLNYHGLTTNHDARPELYIKEIAGKETHVLKHIQKLQDNTPDPDYYQEFLDSERPDYIITDTTIKGLELYLNLNPDQYKKIRSDKYFRLYKRAGE